MIQRDLFKKFLTIQFIASVEVCNIARCSSKTNESRDIDSIGCRTRNKAGLVYKVLNNLTTSFSLTSLLLCYNLIIALLDLRQAAL